MSYEFDQLIDRRSTNSYKWSVAENELPMWVADMDFDTAPAVKEALKKRIDQGVFGYSVVPDSFRESIVSWWQRRHQWQLEKEWILFCTGAVPAISSIVRKMTKEYENVVVLAPVYNIFYHSILNNNRTVLASHLVYSDGAYSINFTDLEEKLSQPSTKLFIFCNPHNPIGKVWDKETLTKVGNLCVKYDVVLLSDELHCDLTHKGHHYTPMASLSPAIAQKTITCVSPSKAFNLAGLQASAIIISNEWLRKLVNRGINTDEIAEPNAFAIQASEAAFNDGEQWLNGLNVYLAGNRAVLHRKIQEYIPEITIVSAEATYLAWLDCSALTNDTAYLTEFIRKQTGLYISEGGLFGGNGSQFIRWNYACPRALLEEGIQRFIKGIQYFKEGL